MRLYERERLTESLLAVPSLIDRHRQWDGGFIVGVEAWCADLEDVLGRLRNPLVSLVAAQRGAIRAAADADPSEGKRRSRARAERAAALEALQRVEEAIRARVQAIDEELRPLREKLIQFLAVSSARVPIPLPPPPPRTPWLRELWPKLMVGDELRNMYAFLSAALPEADRLALLDEVLDQLLSGNGHLFQASAATDRKA